MTYLDKVIARTLKHEGKYSDDPADRGGKTNWGITQEVARQFGYKGKMRNLPRTSAITIYKKNYILKYNLDIIFERFPILGELVFDFGVNAGQKTALRNLTKVLNALNKQGKLWRDIEKLDKKTMLYIMGRLEKVSVRGGEPHMVFFIGFGLICLWGAHYINISLKRPANERFTKGWLFRLLKWNIRFIGVLSKKWIGVKL